jgi:acetate CoA/acetoacetate CoA-transferase alpha subunit
MSKIISMEEAVSKVNDGMVVMIGGFMAAGTPNNMMTELVKKGVKNLTVICNDTGFVNIGIGKLIANKQIKKVIVSHIGTNPNTIEQFNNKELEVEFVPQGTLIERIRCGGNGLGGILTPTGLGTIVANGKQVLNVNGKDYLLETPLHADIALIGASIADEAGNLYYKGTTQNFNPMMATAADIVVVEAQEIVQTGGIPMENVHTQALFVDYIVKA